jgi:hypothetical protein
MPAADLERWVAFHATRTGAPESWRSADLVDLRPVGSVHG